MKKIIPEDFVDFVMMLGAYLLELVGIILLIIVIIKLLKL